MKVYTLLISLILTFTIQSCKIRINEVEDNSGYNFNYKGSPGIAITWDDNYVNEWYSIRQILKENNVKCTFYITNFSRLDSLRLNMLRALKEDGNEIACHSVNHKDAVVYSNEYWNI